MLKERVERRLEASGRITPREVLDAYEETGLEVGFETYLVGDKACPYGVLMVRDGYTKRHFSIMEWTHNRDRRAGVGYSQGFYYGFDGKSCSPPHHNVTASNSFKKGWRDGQRVRHFVLARMDVA